jgi:hypothetical protein
VDESKKMKTVAISQPTYLPWPGYFRLIKEANIYVFADHVQFESRSWQCRNKIKTPEGWKWLTVPVTHDSLFQPIKDVRISNVQQWTKKHWNILNAYYSKTPYFSTHSSFFRSLYEKNWFLLSELNIEIIKYLASQLGLSTIFLRSSELGISDRRSHLALSICKLLKADRYVSSIGAMEYMRKEKADELFKNEGIKLEFLTYSIPSYPQLYGDFVPNLSFVDGLFNCGADSAKILFCENSATFQSLY